MLQAVALERPDQTPVVLEYSGFAAYITQTSMSEFLSSPSKATETMIRAYELIGGGDAVNYGTFSPYGLCYLFGSKVRVPGIDLPDKDSPVLMAAVAAKTDYLLTGDVTHFGKHFGKTIMGVRISTARDYLISKMNLRA